MTKSSGDLPSEMALVLKNLALKDHSKESVSSDEGPREE